MADQEGLAEQAKRNGGEAGDENGALRDRLTSLNGIARSRRRRAQSAPVRAPRGDSRVALARRVRRTLTANLDDRDPDYIRENLPLSWLLTTLWFRGEVRNMGNVPEEGPVLLVANHSGGNMTPDTLLFTLAFYTYFGVERAFYQLAHNLVLASPVGQILRRYGTVRPRPSTLSGARRRRRPARLPGRRLGGAPPDLGATQGRLRGPQGIRPAGARSRRADRSGGLDRRPGDGPVPQPRRPSGASPARRPDAASEGDPDLARAALGTQRRRSARPHPPAREDHGRGPGPDRRARRSSATTPTSTTSTTTSPRLMQETLDTLAAERRYPLIG